MCYNPRVTESPGNPFVSIVVPIFNEEGNIAPLVRDVARALTGTSYEIVAVNDGSTDNSPAELNALRADHPELRIITLKRNFGQTASMAAGIDHARGDIIIPLDGDGQNDPEDVPVLLKKLEEGYDVVSGWRRDRQDKLVSRKVPSWIANALISYFTGVHLHDYGCTLKAYRRSILANVQLSGEMHRFLPAWCVWQGGRVAEVPVKHHPRTRGVSKYGLSRIFKVLIDLITFKFFSGYLFKPNYLFTGMAMLFIVIAGAAGLTAVVDKFGPDRFPQFRIPLLLVAVFFGLVSVFLVLLGLLSELLVRLYFQVREQKPYRLADE